MAQTKLLTIRIDEKLKNMAQKKAQEEFGLGLGTITKIFLQAFVGKSTVRFYLGDKGFDQHIDELMKSKKVKESLKKLAKDI